jgi:hypothetical protein
MNLTLIKTLSILVLLMVGGCTLTSNAPDVITTPLAAPTNHFFFSSSQGEGKNEKGEIYTSEAVPTVASFFSQPKHTPTQPRIQVTSRITPEPSEIFRKWTKSIALYDDRIRPGWKILSSDMEVKTLGAEQARTGTAAISITPQKDLSQFYLVVEHSSEEVYLRNDVYSLTFFLSGGDDYIQLDELVLTILGSNQYPYYRFRDNSVDFGAQPYFSETRLYYLGLNRSIGPGEWAEVTIKLDDLIYDPNYQYFTGFYLKNDESFWRTFYIDDVSITMLVNEQPKGGNLSSEGEIEEVDLEGNPPSTNAPIPSPASSSPSRRE